MLPGTFIYYSWLVKLPHHHFYTNEQWYVEVHTPDWFYADTAALTQNLSCPTPSSSLKSLCQN